MPCSTNRHPPEAARLFRLFCIVFLVCGLLAGGLARAAGIEIRNPQLSAGEEGGYALSADFHIDLNPHLEEAVNKGVTLAFLVEFELDRPRWYWVDEKLLHRSLTWRLAYHALTRQYRLSSGALHLSFATLDDALQTMARLRRWPVSEVSLRPGDSYVAALRMRLDISQLPKPFQVSALANRDWNLDSGWLRWSLVVPPPLPAQPAPENDNPPESK
jgi:hypothetical protein